MKRFFGQPLLWLILASALPLLSLLHTGMPYLQDGQDHVARIANFYAALREGIIFPRWAANLNWGYGHPILMFLYPLPEYLASAFHFIGFSFVDSTKILFGLSFIASALAMYIWMNAAFGVEAGVLGAILYAFAPYRFVDFYVRGDIGEHVAFIFPPLGMYFLYKLSRTKALRGLILLTLGAALTVAALILAHNAMAIMFLPVIGLYGLYLLLTETDDKRNFIVAGLSALGIGFALSAFFWVPALMEGKFTLRDIVTAGEALKRFVPIGRIFYSPWNYGQSDTLSKFLGFAQWAGVAGSLYLVFKAKDKSQKILIGGMLAVLFISFFIMTAASASIWRVSTLLQDFQFPWRFLAVSVFISSALGGISVAWFLRKSKKLFIIFCVVSIALTVTMWAPKGYQYHDDSFYSGMYPGTTDTGESSPIWSVRFMEHAADHPLNVIDGDATVQEGKRTTTVHEYTITVRKPTLMMENTLYFPGWMIYINGIATGIEWQNPNYRGLMTFRMTPGANQTVRVIFGDTRVRMVSDWLSLISLVFVTITGMVVIIWQKK